MTDWTFAYQLGIHGAMVRVRSAVEPPPTTIAALNAAQFGSSDPAEFLESLRGAGVDFTEFTTYSAKDADPAHVQNVSEIALNAVD